MSLAMGVKKAMAGFTDGVNRSFPRLSLALAGACHGGGFRIGVENHHNPVQSGVVCGGSLHFPRKNGKLLPYLSLPGYQDRPGLSRIV